MPEGTNQRIWDKLKESNPELTDLINNLSETESKSIDDVVDQLVEKGLIKLKYNIDSDDTKIVKD